MYTLKKSLGQHFLKDENICRKIVAALQRYPFTQLIEVGPGGGALTKYLLELNGFDFKAVELDDEKVEYLLMTYPELKGKIIHRSFLDMEKPFAGKFTVVGNFPYNISTQILFKIIEWKDDVECMIGMFQKEVADRVAAPPGSKVYGITSVLVQAFYDVESLFNVEPGSFIPPPKVRSSVLRCTRKDGFSLGCDEVLFKRMVKMAFNQRRKMLRNTLKEFFPPERLADDPFFQRRPETLGWQEFANLAKECAPK